MHTIPSIRRPNRPARWLSVLAATTLTAAICLSVTARARAQSAAGTLDTTYAPDLGDFPFVGSIVVRPDGRIVIGGQFSGVTRLPDDDIYIAIAGLTSAGTLDTSFYFYTNRRTIIDGVSLAPDGKVYIIGGPFTPSPVRLNADGTADTGFTLASELGNSASLPAILADGRLMVSTTLANGNSAIARLNANGTEDGSFRRLESSKSLGPLVVQSNGKLVYNNAGTIAQLNTDGTPDPSFNTSIVTTSGQFFIPVEAMALQADGKILVGGSFSAINGSPCGGLTRLNADGSVDNSFHLPSGTDGRIVALTVQPDGKILVGGYFTHLDGVARGHFARLNADASIDTTFSAGVGADGVVSVIALLPDNNLLIGGGFKNFDGTPRGGIARIHDTLTSAHPAFFAGEAAVGNGAYFLSFPGGNPFGYYSYLADPAYIFHFDLGYEYVFDAKDGRNGAYFYDFASNGFFYTSPGFPFPYLYDFSLNSTVYYYPNPANPGRYNTNGIRYFYVFGTGQIISK